MSNLTPRIMVSGEPKHLTDNDNAHRIRANLLAAIRSTVLWRQLGGSRFGLVFSRRAYIGACRHLMEQFDEDFELDS